MIVKCTCSLSFRKTVYCCLNTWYDCVVWLFKIIRNFKQKLNLYSKTYTFYFKVWGHSIMWVCHFKYLLHNWTWLNAFHIQRISRPHTCKGPRAWNSAAGRGAHLLLFQIMYFCGLHLFCQCHVLLRASELWQPLCFLHCNQKSHKIIFNMGITKVNLLRSVCWSSVCKTVNTQSVKIPLFCFSSNTCMSWTGSMAPLTLLWSMSVQFTIEVVPQEVSVELQKSLKVFTVFKS